MIHKTLWTSTHFDYIIRMNNVKRLIKVVSILNVSFDSKSNVHVVTPPFYVLIHTIVYYACVVLPHIAIAILHTNSQHIIMHFLVAASPEIKHHEYVSMVMQLIERGRKTIE